MLFWNMPRTVRRNRRRPARVERISGPRTCSALIVACFLALAAISQASVPAIMEMTSMSCRGRRGMINEPRRNRLYIIHVQSALRGPEWTEHIPVFGPLAYHLFHCIKHVLRQSYHFASLVHVFPLPGENRRKRSHIKPVMMPIPDIAGHNRGTTFQRQRCGTGRHVGFATEECDGYAFACLRGTINKKSHELIIAEYS